MGLFQPAGGTGYFKAGFMGLAGRGKTYTATKVAIGVRKFFKLKGPIAMIDTEGGATYVGPMVKEETKLDLVVVRDRSLKTALEAIAEAQKEKYAVLIIDSVTHIWNEVKKSYLKKINDALVLSNRQPRSLTFRDWDVIKEKFSELTDQFLNAPLHMEVCGRLGYEWDFEEIDGKKELVKTATKMKAETEFGHEPPLLVEMDYADNTQQIREAFVKKDRFSILDGKRFLNPTFENFLPHVQMLTPGAHAPVDTTPKTEIQGTTEGDREWQHESRQREVLIEEIGGVFELVGKGGQAKEDKEFRTKMLKKHFNTTSWKALESMKSGELRERREQLAGELQNLVMAKEALKA